MLFLLSVARALVEVALLGLFGQGVVALLSGCRRDANPIYRLFAIVTKPALDIVRIVAPRPILDRHLPFVAFPVLLWLWLALAWLKRLLAG
jgi:hypothetical protein